MRRQVKAGLKSRSFSDRLLMRPGRPCFIPFGTRNVDLSLIPGRYKQNESVIIGTEPKLAAGAIMGEKGSQIPECHLPLERFLDSESKHKYILFCRKIQYIPYLRRFGFCLLL